MNKIVIFGNSDFAHLIKWYLINDANLNVVAVTVDDEFVNSDSFDGVPVIPFSKLANKYLTEDFGIIICIGYNEMNLIRKHIYEKCKKYGYKIMSYVHSSAIIAKNAILGEGNIILERAVIQPFVKIGIGNIIWSNANISHDDTIGNFNFFAPASTLAGNVKVGNNCFFGNNCTIRNGVRVADFSLVGAGTYINSNTLTNSIYKNNGKILRIDNYGSINF